MSSTSVVEPVDVLEYREFCLTAGQRKREIAETKARQERFNKGLRDMFDRITGAYSTTKRQNELEAHHAIKRDQKQRDTLIFGPMEQRRELSRKSGKLLEKGRMIRLELNRDRHRLRSSKKSKSLFRDNLERKIAF